VDALVTDPKDPVWVRTPITPAEQSSTARIAQFTLSPEGTLEGDVRVILGGHSALTWRARYGSQTPEERLDNFRRRTTARFSDAHLSNEKFTFPDDPAKGAGYTYHIVIPGFAQRTGKRLFFAPAVFESEARPIFSEAKREYPICFDYPWSEIDNIRIKLPDGYELDHAEQPPSFNFGSGAYNLHIAVSSAHEIVYQRSFSFGSNGMLIFGVDAYPQLKAIFDRIHESDTHMLTLKVQQAPSAAAATATAQQEK
jgi:hypothetical protein